MQGTDSNSELGSFSSLTEARKHQYNNTPISTLVIVVFSVATLLVVGGIVCCWLLRSRVKERQNDDEEAQANKDDRESITEESIDDLDRILTIKEWNPSKETIGRGSPIHKDDAQVGFEITLAEPSPQTVELFPDSRGFGSFDWSDDSSIPDDESDDGIEPTVDLVNAGVFKRTLRILKDQPRCVLCSVCFKAGDKISVSNNPACEHQYHQNCIRTWIKTKSSECPVCRIHYTRRPNLDCMHIDSIDAAL